MASPRRQLLDAVATCLRQIRQGDGYATNAGDVVTLEPGQVEENAEAVLSPVVIKQERPSEPSKVQTHRLTTVAVMAKVPAMLDESQGRLDDIVSDVERAMANKQNQYPPGFEFPRYLAMEPVKPEAGMGWTGALITYQSHIPIK